MSIQSIIQETAIRIDDALVQSHRTGDRVEVNTSDLSIIMEAFAASWPQKETTEDLTAKIQYLLDAYVPSEEGHFVFPDGDSWVVRDSTKKKKSRSWIKDHHCRSRKSINEMETTKGIQD